MRQEVAVLAMAVVVRKEVADRALVAVGVAPRGAGTAGGGHWLGAMGTRDFHAEKETVKVKVKDEVQGRVEWRRVREASIRA